MSKTRNAFANQPFISQMKLSRLVGKGSKAYGDTSKAIERHEVYPARTFQSLDELYEALNKEKVDSKVIASNRFGFLPDGTVAIDGEPVPAYLTFIADLCRRLGYAETNWSKFNFEKVMDGLHFLLSDRPVPLGVQFRDGKLFSVAQAEGINTSFVGLDNGAKVLKTLISKVYSSLSTDAIQFEKNISYDEKGIKVHALDTSNAFVPEGFEDQGKAESYWHGLKFLLSTRGNMYGRIVSTVQRISCSNSTILPLSQFQFVRGDDLVTLINGAVTRMTVASKNTQRIGANIALLARLQMTAQAAENFVSSLKAPEMQKIKLRSELAPIVDGNGTAYTAFNLVTHYATHGISGDKADAAQTLCGHFLDRGSNVWKGLACNAENAQTIERFTGKSVAA